MNALDGARDHIPEPGGCATFMVVPVRVTFLTSATITIKSY